MLILRRSRAAARFYPPPMQPSWRKYLELNVPRYTSYPSALAFSDAVGPGRYRGALAGIGNDEPVSLYLHIPFCKKLCWYCGCNMRVENRDERIAAFVDHLLDELALVGSALGGRGRVSQVHFGGGTPNVLAISDLSRVTEAVKAGFSCGPSVPMAMEIDPRLCRRGDPARLRAAGITRFSIGVQDFDERVQRDINRVQPPELVAATVAELRDAGADDISFDVLYGLPYQTPCSFRRSIETIVALGPERVSMFGYTHMPSRLKHQRMMDETKLPSRELRLLLSEIGAGLLIDAGFERIGFDHFARPGTAIAQAARQRRLNRNFQGFTEDPAEVVIGVGPSAISTVHGVFAQNSKGLVRYRQMLGAGELPVERGLVSSLEEEDLGWWLKRLLCDMRGNLSQYGDILERAAASRDRALARLEPFIADGIVTIEGDEVVVRDEAKPLARAVAACFDPHTEDPSKFVSPTV